MKVLVFAAHPDDAEVGCGGTIAKYASEGHAVRIVTTVVPSQHEVRLEESRTAARILGAEHECLDIPPDDMVFTRAIVRKFDEAIAAFGPDLILTHWNQDSHNDHQVVASATVAAARKNSCSVYMYEQTIPGGITSRSFRAQKYIDITPTIEKKIDSIKAHLSQMNNNGDWWLYGIRGRAQYRGFQIRKRYAEAFEVIKDIEY
jgi:LmbE family N-acetylglucosaminyl deacetylase